MSNYPDDMNFHSGPYAPQPRDLTEHEWMQLNQLLDAIGLLQRQRVAMSEMEDHGLEYGPRYCDDAYASMITDMRCEIAEIEKRPQAELDAQPASRAEWRRGNPFLRGDAS